MGDQYHPFLSGWNKITIEKKQGSRPRCPQEPGRYQPSEVGRWTVRVIRRTDTCEGWGNYLTRVQAPSKGSTCSSAPADCSQAGSRPHAANSDFFKRIQNPKPRVLYELSQVVNVSNQFNLKKQHYKSNKMYPWATSLQPPGKVRPLSHFRGTSVTAQVALLPAQSHSEVAQSSRISFPFSSKSQFSLQWNPAKWERHLNKISTPPNSILLRLPAF